jgi:hypothetical protein
MGLFALIAAILFVYAAFGGTVGTLNVIYLAVAFFFLHFAWEIVLPVGGYRRGDG